MNKIIPIWEPWYERNWVQFCTVQMQQWRCHRQKKRGRNRFVYCRRSPQKARLRLKITDLMLVVEPQPEKYEDSSIGMMTFPIYGKIIQSCSRKTTNQRVNPIINPMENHHFPMVFLWFSYEICWCFLCFFLKAELENPRNKWRCLAGKIIYFYGSSIPWLC